MAEPINTALSSEAGVTPIYNKQAQEKKRGIQVYTVSQIMALTGRGKDGQLLKWGTETPFFYLTIQQRNQIFKLSSPVFGIVSSRMNRLSGLGYNIVPKKKSEDEIASQLKDANSLFHEYADDNYGDMIVRARAYRLASSEMPDLRPDFSNFQPALYRWKRKLQSMRNESSQKIMDWLGEPSNGVKFSAWIKKATMNMLVHGCDGVYKYFQNGVLENFDSLPGGSVYRIKDTYFSNVNGYIQLAAGFEPQMFFGDEMAYMEYLPTSTQSYPFIPLEALINKVAETLLFDKMSADQADGTQPPQKMIIVTDNSPFGSLESETMGKYQTGAPIDRDEQDRIEEKINEPIKNSLMTFTGNSVEVVDLSRDQMFDYYSARQKDIREEVALVFNASNIEVNLTGADSTSGRSTSDAQIEITQGRGIAPIAKTIAETLTVDILPYRFGSGWKFEFDMGRDEKSELELDALRLQTGELTQNELRESKNKPTFSGDEFDKPQSGGGGGQGQGVQPDGSNINPFFMRMA